MHYSTDKSSPTCNDSVGSTATSAYSWETLFAGYRWDSDSGLYQVRWRFLNSALGSWLTRDPVQLAIEGTNLYGYASGRPILERDPMGLIESQTHGQAVEGIMVHSEVEPGQAAGNVHLQKGEAKWYVDPQTREVFSIENGQRVNAPKSLRKILQRSPKLQNNIDNAIRRVNAGGGFAPQFITAAVVTGIVLAPYDQYVSAGEQKGLQLVRKGPLCNTLRCLEESKTSPFSNRTTFPFKSSGVTYTISVVAVNGKCYFRAFHTEERFSWTLLSNYKVPVEDITGTDCEARNRRPIGGVCK